MITQIINAESDTVVVFLNPENYEVIRKEVKHYGLVDNTYLEPFVYVQGKVIASSNLSDVVQLGMEYQKLKKSWTEDITLYKKLIEQQKEDIKNEQN